MKRFEAHGPMIESRRDVGGYYRADEVDQELRRLQEIIEGTQQTVELLLEVADTFND